MGRSLPDVELESARRRARAAWPGIAVPDHTFDRELISRVRSFEGEPGEVLRAMYVEDLYLAVGCARGDEAALAAFERRHVPEMRAALAGMGLSDAAREETLQVMREELFVAPPEARPRILNYGARGGLRRWLRAVATRTALRDARARARAVELDESVTAGASEDDLEIAYLRRTYGEAFQQSFREALAALLPKERLLLRQRLRHHLTVEELGALHGVHASTVSRWVADARARLVAGTRERMMHRFDLGRPEASSILRLIHSQLDVTLRSVERASSLGHASASLPTGRAR